jgi:ankyrin repeat protein
MIHIQSILKLLMIPSVALTLWIAQSLNNGDLAGPSLNERLIFASGNGDLRTADAALESGASPNARDEQSATPLMWAASSNDRALCSRLLKSGADINASDRFGTTPLMFAARGDRAELVQ